MSRYAPLPYPRSAFDPEREYATDVDASTAAELWTIAVGEKWLEAWNRNRARSAMVAILAN